ncbi:MAG: hypothetical protein J6Q15_00025, partial [Clostridia bacterium]|nr:hypothetical protein [Clostridia bacterium]
EYSFLVLTSEGDYSKVKYNSNLLQVDTNDDGLTNYISATKFDLLADNEGKYNFELAYLNYLPNANIAGQVGWVKTNSSELLFDIVEYNDTTDYSSKIVIVSNTLTTYPSVIKVDVITMNGVVSTIDLVITDTNIAYGYDGEENDYETVWAGTQVGKLTDKDANKNVRVLAQDNLNDPTNHKDMFIDSEYEVVYHGAVLGKVSHLPIGTELNFGADNKDLISYTNKIVSSRSVASTTYVTMIFDITHTIDGVEYIINRIYYKLRLENDIKIGVNSTLDTQSAIELYLGSDIYKVGYSLIASEEEYALYNAIYTRDENNNYTLVGGSKPAWVADTYYAKNLTTINLLESTDGTNNNNLFVTLEQYSTGQTIDAGKALYNGTNNSELSQEVVNSYLRFTVTNPSNELKGKVSVASDGKLYIKGNPKGSFTLNVFSANGTGYGESFTVSVNQYDITTSRYNDRINDNNSAGYISGQGINLFNSNTSNTDADKYAFEMYRLGYGVGNNVESSILGDDGLGVDGVEVFYQIAVFDDNTTVSTIKNSTDTDWGKKYILGDDLYDVDDDAISDNIQDVNKIKLPSVKYSSDPEIREYQIVSYRLGITYNGETKYYYANYKVYNEVQISVNEYYSVDNKNKVITYKDTNGAWVHGNTITIMDINNVGMYLMLTPVRMTSRPAKWEDVETSYYKRLSNDKDSLDYNKFVSVADGEIWDKNTAYYKLNDIASNISRYTAWLVKEDGTEKQIENLTLNDDGDAIVGTLPDGLFENQQAFRFELRSAETILLQDGWTFKANTAITAKHSSKPLRDFFLTSEIGDQDYYNINIIGMGESYADFVNGANSYVEEEVTAISLPGYTLMKVTYEGDSVDTHVFTIKATYYVLVGHDTAM